MIDVRCKNCDKILLKANIFVGAIKCHKCYMVFEYTVYGNSVHITNQYDKIKSESQETRQHDAAPTNR